MTKYLGILHCCVVDFDLQRWCRTDKIMRMASLEHSRNQGLHTCILIAYQWAILASLRKVLLEYVGAFTLKAGMITCSTVATEEPRSVNTNGL